MEHNTFPEANNSTSSQEISRILCNQTVHHRPDLLTMHSVELHCICPLNAKYMLTIMFLIKMETIRFLLHFYMFRCYTRTSSSGSFLIFMLTYLLPAESFLRS